MDAIVFFVLGVLIIGIGLVVSIGLHEIGHLVPAKLFGVYVTQYMIGFGKTLWSRRIGETEYGLKAIPFGGYIGMIGMYPKNSVGAGSATRQGMFRQMANDARAQAASQIPEGKEHRTFIKLPVLKRVIIMLCGPLMNLLLGFVFIAITICGFGIYTPTLTVDSVSKCVLPVTSSRQVCQSTDELSPGAAAGVKPGDKITAVDGKHMTTWGQLANVLRSSANNTLDVTIDRGGRSLDLLITPRPTVRYVTDANRKVLTKNGKSVTDTVGFVGVGPKSVMVRQPLSAVPAQVGDYLGSAANLIAHLPQRLYNVAVSTFGDAKRDADGPISVVGVGRVAGEIAADNRISVSDKAATMFGILGSLNLALFAFNLIPLTPMDGGHAAGAIWEGIRRGWAKLFRLKDPGPFDAAKLVPITMFVFGLLIAMSVLLVLADLINPISITG